MNGCKYETVYRRALIHHMNTMHKDEKNLICPYCGYKTEDKSTFGRHIKNHDSSQVYKCAQCNYTSSKVEYVKRHMLKHSRQYGKETGSYATQTHPMNLFICDECEFQTTEVDELHRHIHSNHADLTSWGCSRCEFRNSSQEVVLDHIVNMHDSGAEMVQHHVAEVNLDQNLDQEGTNQEQVSYIEIDQVDMDGNTLIWVSENTGEEESNAISTTEENIYACGTCGFTSIDLQVISSHIYTDHPSSLPDDQGTSNLDYANDNIVEVIEVSSSDIDNGLSGNPPMVNEAAHVVTLENEAVSTAVESILHLQQISMPNTD